MHNPMDLVALAEYVQKADQSTRSAVSSKLNLISDQIRALQMQAQAILEQAQHDVKLNHAKSNFLRVPGTIYHLYEKPEGDFYWSMLSPSDWGRRGAPDKYDGSYRLEYDASWTPIEGIARKDAPLDPVLLGLKPRQPKNE